MSANSPSQPAQPGVVRAPAPGLLRHMHAIAGYRQVFDRLQSSWDTLTLLGQLSGNATEMSGTRTAFETLTAELLAYLASETLDKTVGDLRIKAQNVIDVLVRNLFERTADIGFLAADTTIRELLDGDEEPDARQAIERHFRDYVAKYSVYSDIVLVDLDGRIRARLAPHEATTARHAVITEALSPGTPYVEHYGQVDFVSAEPSLVYCCRVEGAAGQPAGVLVLAFRLADEMAGIFAHLLAPEDDAVLACIDGSGRVVAGSCRIQLPLGLTLQPPALGKDALMRIGGRQYLAAACDTTGYQGYLGPGWRGLCLLPVDVAFDRTQPLATTQIEGDTLAEVADRSGLFSEALLDVSRKAAIIQGDLNRSVWNGSIRQAGSTESNAAFSKVLLQEIAKAGSNTQAVFEASIGDLHRTVLEALMRKCQSRAAFAIDLMDRNLYERANDCRWWALNASLARALAQPSREGARACAGILGRIHELYTVYSNLILFDAKGVVVAVSKAEQGCEVGDRLDADWVERTLALRSGQHYAVSDFAPTPLYADASTYIYTAAVIEHGAARALGGIAIVFDSTPQFSAILTDSLPTDEAGRALPGAFALLVGSDGRLIASTDARYRVGETAPLGLDAGDQDGVARLAVWDGHYVVLGRAISRGYREYKTSDGHRDDIVALCGVRLGSAEATLSAKPAPSGVTMTSRLRKPPDGVDALEVATFHIGRHWLGVPAHHIVEAVDFDDIKPPARQSEKGLLAGYKLHGGEAVPVLRLDRLLGVASDSPGEGQIVIVRAAGRVVGLLVERLGELPRIARTDIRPVRELTARTDVPALGVVATQDEAGIAGGTLMLLDTDQLGARLRDGAGPTLLQAAE